MPSNLLTTPGAYPIEVTSVWYTGTDVLKVGYAICRDTTQIGGTDDQDGISGAKPTFANLNQLLGVVSPDNAQSVLEATVARKINIVPVHCIGFGVPIWCDENIAVGDLLGVQPNSWTFIKGAIFNGIIVARSEQAVDRSSTAGTCLAEFGALNPLIGQTERASKVQELIGLADVGGMTATTTSGVWIGTQVTAGTAQLTSDGVLKMTGGSAADADGYQIQRGGVEFILEASRKMYFAMDIQLNNATALTGADVFAGLCALDTTIFAAGAENTQDYIGWIKSTGDGVMLFQSDKGNTNPTGQTGATLVAGTYKRFACYINGLTSAVNYIDSVLSAAAGFAAADIPVVGITPSFSCKANGAVTAPIMLVRNAVFRKQVA